MNIIVTGASRGIGFEMVQLLSAQGHNVLAVARSKEKLLLLQKCCATHAGKVDVLDGDIGSPDFCQKLEEKVCHIYKVLDALVNNAGKLLNKPFESIDSIELEEVYRVNVFAPFAITQAMVPHLEKAEVAHVVNIGSMGGFQGAAKFSGLSAYSSSKQALAGMTECLAEELSEKNIRVNCLALGAAQTEMLNEAFPDYKAPVSAKEMATYIANFVLGAHQYMNGKIIPVALSTP